MENLLRVVELLFIFVVGPVLLLACWLFIFYSNQWWPFRPKPVIEPEPESDLCVYEDEFSEFKRYYRLSDEEVTEIESDKELRVLLCWCFRSALSEYQDSHEAHDVFNLFVRRLWHVDAVCFRPWLGWLDFGAKVRANRVAKRDAVFYSEKPNGESSPLEAECKPEATAGATADIGISNRPIEP